MTREEAEGFAERVTHALGIDDGEDVDRWLLIEVLKDVVLPALNDSVPGWRFVCMPSGAVSVHPRT